MTAVPPLSFAENLRTSGCLLSATASARSPRLLELMIGIVLAILPVTFDRS
jgi:hypothetical protein